MKILALIMTLVLSACGMTGELYLVEEDVPVEPAAVPVITTDSRADNRNEQVQ